MIHPGDRLYTVVLEEGGGLGFSPELKKIAFASFSLQQS